MTLLSDKPENLIHSLGDAIVGRMTIDSLVEELRGYSELTIFDNKMQFRGDSAVGVTLPRLGEVMIERARKVGAAKVVHDLIRYCSTEEIPYREIMILSGITLPATINLAGSITMVPFETLPSSVWKEHVVQLFGRSWQNYKPTVAVQRSVIYPREHVEPAPQLYSSVKVTFQELDDVRLCITAIGPSAPVWLGFWLESPDWMPNLGGGWARLPEPLNVGGYPRTTACPSNDLIALHNFWVKLSDRERRHLRVPLSRINSALRRSEIVDSAIDLGIAMDALFLSEKEADRGELAFTLRLRAARFLGADEATRKEISKTFSDVFSLRSAAVHSGMVKETTNGWETKELLAAGYRLTAEAMRRIIKEGEPDWRGIVFK